MSEDKALVRTAGSESAPDYGRSTAPRGYTSGTIRELDGLRGIAVSYVGVYHFAMPYLSTPAAKTSALGMLLGLGWSGVDLFFVLSGFLITGILMDSRRATNYFSGFIARRALRILPLYYLTLFVFFVAVPTARAILGIRLMPSLPVNDQFWFWVYLHNWVQPFGIDSPLIGHLWSLAVEEQFYLLWPLVILVVGKHLRRVMALCAVVAVASLVSRFMLLHDGVSPAALYRWTVCRLDGLALGGLLAAVWRYQPRWLVRIVWLGCGAAVALVFAAILSPSRLDHRGPFMLQVGFSLVALFFLGVLALALVLRGTRSPIAQALRWGPLRSVGRVSYGMYIFHIPIYALLAAALSHSKASFAWATSATGSLVVAAAGLACAYAVAWASWHTLEKRANALKTRFAPRMPAGAGELAA